MSTAADLLRRLWNHPWLGPGLFLCSLGLIVAFHFDTADLLWGAGTSLAVGSIPYLGLCCWAFLSTSWEDGSIGGCVMLPAFFLGLFLVFGWPLLALGALSEALPLSQVIGFDRAQPFETAGRVLLSFIPWTVGYLLINVREMAAFLNRRIAAKQSIIAFGFAVYLQSSVACLVLGWAVGRSSAGSEGQGTKFALLAETISYFVLNPALLKRVAVAEDRPARR